MSFLGMVFVLPVVYVFYLLWYCSRKGLHLTGTLDGSIDTGESKRETSRPLLGDMSTPLSDLVLCHPKTKAAHVFGMC